MGTNTPVFNLYEPSINDTINTSIPSFATNSQLIETAILGRQTLTTYYEELYRPGLQTVANNVLPPGHRVGWNTTLSAVVARVGTAPLGTALVITLTRLGTVMATVSIGAGLTSATTAGLAFPLTVGDIVQLNITAIGSSQAGSDLAVAFTGV